MRTIAIIPARYASTRFPGKPLHVIAGKPLVRHVVERCRAAASLVDVIVATDDERIAAVARGFARVEMTAPEHPSGSDRIAEVARRIECDAIINVQGDEPLIDPAVIDAVAACLVNCPMSTAATRISDVAELDNPNVVKVVCDQRGRAMYFSRRTIPYFRDLADGAAAERLAAYPFRKHLGIYGYRRETLLEMVGHAPSPLEMAEKLEQLRALEHGIAIAVEEVAYESIGVDTPEDAARVAALLEKRLSV
jgi:3-deoxy-manno-octulosonate cytidylyltransferase (CMP-KDO synthetase)